MNCFHVIVVLCFSLLHEEISLSDEKMENELYGLTIFTEETNKNQNQIPVLCYHNIKPVKKGISYNYTIDVDKFYAHMKMLSDSGYAAISPDQLYEHLVTQTALPIKSILITFDDSHEEHFSTAAPILKHFGFVGVFFITTVTIDKPSYLTSAQIKELSDSGHVIAGHTWNHVNLKTLKDEDWILQISAPKKLLEKITGKPVYYFAYPYGAWDEKAISELKKRGVIAAFQLSEKESETEPLYTIRRLMVNGNWSDTTLYNRISKYFHK